MVLVVNSKGTRARLYHKSTFLIPGAIFLFPCFFLFCIVLFCALSFTWSTLQHQRIVNSIESPLAKGRGLPHNQAECCTLECALNKASFHSLMLESPFQHLFNYLFFTSRSITLTNSCTAIYISSCSMPSSQYTVYFSAWVPSSYLMSHNQGRKFSPSFVLYSYWPQLDIPPTVHLSIIILTMTSVLFH